MPSKPKGTDRCGAKTQSGKQCRHWAGTKTDHPGTGVCWLHEREPAPPKPKRRRGAPKGNKNAVITGEYEQLHISALPQNQRDLYERIEADPVELHTQEIKLSSIREHRILLRIGQWEEALLDSEDGLEVTSTSAQDGWNVKGKVDLTTIERAPILETIKSLEEALTRVQRLKSTQIQMLSLELEKTHTNSGGLEAIVDVIDRSARKIAQAREQGG